MLADPEIQVVCILTPNHLHIDAVLQAARAGKHILVEKPPAMSLHEMDTMEAASKAAGVKLGVVLQCRTRRAVQAIRKAVLEGRFGKILHADTFMKWFRSRNITIGCLALVAALGCRRDHSAGVPLHRSAPIPRRPR